MLVERFTLCIDVGLMLFVIFLRRSVRYLCYYVMDVPYIYCIACLECIYAFFVMMDVFFTLKTDKIQKKQQGLPSVFTLTLGKATIFLFPGKHICRV